MRRDGFYSMDAGSTSGTLTTRPVKFTGKRLFVNVDNPAGSLQIEILDSNGQPIAPFTQVNCNVVSVNKTLQEVTWTGAADLSSLIGQPVKFRFHLTNGSLYAFWVSPDASGASRGYVAAGGPGFTGPIDTVGSGGVLPTINACDLNGDGLVTVVDLQLEINAALGLAPCTHDINKDGPCNIVDVQRVVIAALGGQCVGP